MTDLTGPYGVSIGRDLARYLGAESVRTVFDVGAHEGESLEEFASRFPDARIFSFEPLPAAFARLRDVAGRHPRAQIFNLALSDAPDVRPLHSGRHSCLTSLLPSGAEFAWPTSPLADGGQTACDTLDRFAARLGVETIDVLKIDVQGAEHLVLAGAHDLLDAQRIRSVRLEVLFLALYVSQATFHDLLATMAGHAFRFAGLYDCFYDQRGWLGWADALFIHESVRRDVPRPALP